MAKKREHVVCTTCFVGQDQELKQSFLGFFSFKCAHCNADSKYPLSAAYFAIYTLAVFIFLGTMMSALVGGGTPSCGILGVGGIIALSLDFGIRRKARAAEKNEQARA